MRITTEQLQQQLARGVRPLYTVFGDEPLLALEAADRIRRAAREHGYDERVVLVADTGFRWNELAAAASARSLFAARQLIEVRIPGGKPGADGSVALQTHARRLPEDTITLVQLPAIDWRGQKSEWFAALESAGVSVEARAVSRKALPQWLAGRLQAQQQQADADALAFIADRVEGNLMAAYQEVQKLALLCPPGRITFADARDAVLDVARYDVSGLGEAVLEGDPLRIARTLDGLKGEGVALPHALWILAEEIRAFGRVVTGAAAGKPAHTLFAELRIRGARQSLMQAALPGFTPAEIAQALRHAAQVDRIIKGLEKGDAWEELLQLALRFARARRTHGETRSRTPPRTQRERAPSR